MSVSRKGYPSAAPTFFPTVLLPLQPAAEAQHGRPQDQHVQRRGARSTHLPIMPTRYTLVPSSRCFTSPASTCSTSALDSLLV